MKRAFAIIAIMLAFASPPVAAAKAAGPAAGSPTARTAARFDRIASSPPRLRMFLQQMPKGADLHNHGGGAVYAEDFLRWAAADGLCIATDIWHIVAPPCDAPNRLPAAGLEKDYPRYSRMIDSLSTRGFEDRVGDPRISGYDRFFATFAAFGATTDNSEGKALAATRQQAAADRVSYIELGAGSRAEATIGATLSGMDPTNFAGLMVKLEPLLPAAVAQTRADYDRYEAQSAEIDHCNSAAPRPACQVEMRYLFTALRTIPAEQVFAQLALGFAMVEADPRFAGVNIAAPEHDPIAVRDYSLHMRMIAFLKARHPRVQLSLHAGELTMGLVPPRDLAFHIREAVEVAGARRIGHGIDISYETDAAALLGKMAQMRVAVEINLTSNAVILGVKGAAHPLSLYREAGVPVVLSTDDQGVSRSDMTNEYQRAVTEQGLRYADLKQIVRDSLEYSFLPGASLWQGRAGGLRVAACSIAVAPACTAFVTANPKAAKQLNLEVDFEQFESKY